MSKKQTKSKKTTKKEKVSTKKPKGNVFTDMEHALRHFKDLEERGDHPTEDEYFSFTEVVKEQDEKATHESIFKFNKHVHKGKTVKGKDYGDESSEEIHPSHGKARSNWTSQSKTQVVNPMRKFAPETLADIEGILADAVENDLTVRAVGSGHSYSDCVAVDDYLITTFELKKYATEEDPLPGQLSEDMIRGDWRLCTGQKMEWDDYDPEKNVCLMEMEGGVRLRNLTTYLDTVGLALPNMGGFDGQTIVGVTSTATHGSGIGIPCLSDIIKSLVIATTGRLSRKHTDEVNIYRIEPKNGITDPTKWNDPKIKLIQSDTAFYSAICSMGCFGIIYSVTVELMQEYYLQESRIMSTLDKVFEDLQPNPNNEGHIPDVLLNHRHYEVLIQPYAMHKDKPIDIDFSNPEATYPQIPVLITSRNIAPKPKKIIPSNAEKHPIMTAIEEWGGTFEILSTVVNTAPPIIPMSVTNSMKSLAIDDHTDLYHKIFIYDLDGSAGVAAEVAFPVEDREKNYTHINFMNAINKIHELCQVARIKGKQYNTSGFSLRFVKESQAHMSMMQGYNSALIELDMLTGTYADTQIFHRYEKAMYQFGGRPHWGLDYDVLTRFDSCIQELKSGTLSSMVHSLKEWALVSINLSVH